MVERPRNRIAPERLANGCSEDFAGDLRFLYVFEQTYPPARLQDIPQRERLVMLLFYPY